jgi:hypothetical protein
LRRLLYAGLGFLAAGLAIAAVVTQHASWWPLVIFATAPDLALLAGMSGGLARGQLHPRAVPVYNAVHRFWAPAAMVALGLILRSPEWLSAGLAWTAHIGFDRSLGFGLRNRDGFQRQRRPAAP